MPLINYSNNLTDLIYQRNNAIRYKTVSTHSHEYQKQWKTYHSDFVKISAGSTYEFPMIETKQGGVICTIWCTFADLKPWKFLHYHKLHGLKKLHLNIYFDDEQEPRVRSPLGDFFGCGFGYRPRSARSLYVGMTSGGYYCFFPMPFKKNCKITIENTSSRLSCPSFYGVISYQEVPFEESMLYFNAQYKEEKCKKGVPYVILDTKGEGHYVGTVLSMKGKIFATLKVYGVPVPMNYGFLEGNVKFFVDGEEEPSSEWTGNEDYFMGAFYYKFGEFAHLYHGLSHKSWRKISSYRFHPETVPFTRSIKVLVHHGEFDEQKTFYKSVAYWYQKK
ncbi:MAG: glycoside hydrolase family 172 protein [Candidatus Helarchaeales archaeon]